MSSSDDDDVRPKRRRIAVDAEEEEETPFSSPTEGARAERLERRAAERRSRRESITLFPGDDGYQATVDAQEEVVQDYIVEDEDYEEEEDGEDLLDNMEKDYQRIEALDNYGSEGLDDRDYEAMDFDQRRAAEAELARREKGSRNQGFYGMALDNMEEEEDDEARRARRGVFARVEQEEEEEEHDSEDDLEADDQVNLEAFDVPLREWIAQTRTRKEIQRKFRIFLRNFVENDEQRMTRRRGNGMYEKKIRTMCASNLSSLQVSYMHLMEAEPVLAVWVVDAPKDMLDVLNEAATRHTLMLFPSYHAIHKEIHVRITSVPILDSLRDLRRVHLDCLVQVHGVVTRRSAVYPQLQIAHYQCMSCNATQGPFRVEGSGGDTYTPDACPFCEVGSSFKLHPTLSQYRNFQRVNLQETPGSVPPGRVPRTKEVILTNDIIDIARPGEEVEVTGIYEHSYDSSLTLKSGFPVFSTFITANHVQKKEDASSSSNLTESDIAQILELSRDPKIGEKIVASMAPSIYGHENCKMALAMSLFGGVPKNINDKHRIRGDVNVLLLGDPGTAKSQLLKYAESTAPRAVYSTGKGASAVGLTASVHKDPLTKEWTLEGGALVLADRGVCLIDEFDKMNEQDRTSIHEAMEQQSISISKAGIVTSLQARCAVIAAANPIGGRYDSSNTLADNVELTDPILQRFDILCVLQDTVDPVADERMAKFITGSHMRSTPTVELRREVARHGGRRSMPTSVDPNPNVVPQDLLQKYIQYARTHVRPVLRGNTFDQEKIASLYVALRKESAASGGVPIAVRHVESMMRMAEAHAKMHLREYVRDDDMDASISMMLESFLAAQKFSVRRSLRKSFSKFLRTGDDRAHLLLHILQEMFRNEQMYQVIRMRQKGQEEEIESLEVPLDELESKARERRIYDVSEFCKSGVFQEAGYVLDERRRVISRSIE
jgi:DNA replication licensing factor MCM2